MRLASTYVSKAVQVLAADRPGLFHAAVANFCEALRVLEKIVPAQPTRHVGLLTLLETRRAVQVPVVHVAARHE